MAPFTIVCDVGAVQHPSIATVELLCRLDVGARAMGTSLRLRHAAPGLRALVGLLGLGDVLTCEPELGLEAWRQAEEREEALGVEEEGDPGDPVT